MAIAYFEESLDRFIYSKMSSFMMDKAKIRVVFFGTRQMDAGWHYPLFDIEKEAKRLREKLLNLEDKRAFHFILL
jgi:hypothetical protein